MNVRYPVESSQDERAQPAALRSGGKHAARKPKRAQILSAADARARAEDIATSVAAGGSRVSRTKRRFVLDNLSSHSPGALDEAFPAREAHRLLRRLELRYTPEPHASWLQSYERKPNSRFGVSQRMRRRSAALGAQRSSAARHGP